MSDFLYARSQMAMSLAFHIIFAILGIGLPVLMAIAEAVYVCSAFSRAAKVTEN